MIIDFHTHAFADALAEKAVSLLEQTGDIKAFLDGRVSSLCRRMAELDIDRSVLCPVATKPSQFAGIREWARDVRRTVPEVEVLLSVHPDDSAILEHIDEAAAEGFRGFKFHSYYQQFTLTEPRMYPVYERLAAHGLLAVFHCGFDIGFPRDRVVEPRMIRRVADELPDLKFIATHFGGWQDWEESLKHLIGRPIYIETSMTLTEAPPALLRELVAGHPPDYVLFGTDSPWGEQARELEIWRGMGLADNHLAAILGGNAARLLGLNGA